ncbi:hypothetical protein WHZ77_17320 [Bradyrhizobium sp. A5]|uniref:hypothetical protein n=1 Tax=Bradyrhizobium sp. A5 TaxID=3133696 RepID=UPI0032557D1D
MSEHESLFELSIAIQRLRGALENSALPARRLQELRNQAADLSDQCYFHIGSLWVKPNEARAAKLKEAKLAEIAALEAQLANVKRKVGRRPTERVPAGDLHIAMQYLKQPATGRNSVEILVNTAIGQGAYGGWKNVKTDKDVGTIVRRIRRLIKKIEEARLN